MIAEVAAGACRALADARPAVFWSDRRDAPALRPRSTGATEAALVIIGAGFTGLWAAMFATAEAGRRAVVLEAALPFPPEPLRWAGVGLTRRAISRADRRGGQRGPWLSLLDRCAIGFDS